MWRWTFVGKETALSCKLSTRPFLAALSKGMHVALCCIAGFRGPQGFRSSWSDQSPGEASTAAGPQASPFACYLLRLPCAARACCCLFQPLRPQRDQSSFTSFAFAHSLGRNPYWLKQRLESRSGGARKSIPPHFPVTVSQNSE